jgi:hypothetical protein
MARPKIHPDARTRGRLWAAKNHARRKSLSPMERLAEDRGEPPPYTAQEAESVAILKAHLAEAVRLAGEVNASLKARLSSLPGATPYLAELERGFTRAELPFH